jgi:putative membrane protein
MGKKSIITGLICCTLGGVLLLAQASTEPKGTAPKSDQDFVTFAAETDMTEAHLGQLAANQAASQGVKDFGQMLVTDHTNDYQQVSMVASKAGLTVPKGLDAKHEKMVAPFEKLKGAAFDRQFVREMVAGHTKAIAEYKREAQEAQSADVKAYASQTLPTLQKHLEAAQALEKTKPAAKHGKM